MYRSLLLVGLVVLLIAPPPAARAQEQAAAPTAAAPRPIECGRILGAAERSPFDRRLTLLLEVVWESLAADSADPVALTEIWHPEGMLLAHEAALANLSGVQKRLDCAVLVAEFRVGERASEGEKGETLLLAIGDRTVDARLPIVFVTESPEWQRPTNLQRWAEAGYVVPVRFPAFVDNISVPSPESLLLPALFTDSGGTAEEVALLSSESVAAIQVSFPELGQVDLAPVAVAVCDPRPCSEYAQIYATVQSPAPRPRPEEMTEGQGSDMPGQRIDPGTGPAPSPDREIDPVPAILADLADPPVPLTPQIVETAGGVPCFIHALDPRTPSLVAPPACAGEIYAALRDQDFQIEERDGRPVLVARPPPPRPEVIDAVLPEGVSAAGCQLDLVYTGAFGEDLDRPMDPVPGESGRFRVRVAGTLPVRDGEVSFRLVPIESAACAGAPARAVTAAAARRIEVPLFATPPRFSAVQYLFVPARDRLEAEIGADAELARTAASSFVDAMVTAQARVATRETDRTWRLVRAQGRRATASGSSRVLFDLDGDSLRGDVRGFLERAVSAEEMARLGTDSVPVRTASLGGWLSQAISEARDAELSVLDVVILPLVIDNGAGTARNPCRDPRLMELSAALATADAGIDVSVTVLALMKARERQPLAMEDLEPLSLSLAAPTAAGGLFRCRTSNARLAIYPFLVEPWRDAEDALPRFALAATDQVARLLSFAIDGRGAR